jgi:hypothetical protein
MAHFILHRGAGLFAVAFALLGTVPLQQAHAETDGMAVAGEAGNVRVEANAIPLNTLIDELANHLGVAVSGPTVDGTPISVRMSGSFSQVVARLMGQRGYAVAYDNGLPQRLIILPVTAAAVTDPFSGAQPDPMDGGLPSDGDPTAAEPAMGAPDGGGMMPPRRSDGSTQGMTDEEFLMQQQMEQDLLMQGVQPDPDEQGAVPDPYAPKL